MHRVLSQPHSSKLDLSLAQRLPLHDLCAFDLLACEAGPLDLGRGQPGLPDLSGRQQRVVGACWGNQITIELCIDSTINFY